MLTSLVAWLISVTSIEQRFNDDEYIVLLQNPNIKPEAKALLDDENSDGYVDRKHKKIICYTFA